MTALAKTWFERQHWQAHGFQRRTWAAIAKGRSGLLNAPTGYGKTMAVWMGVLQQYYREKGDRSPSPKLHCLWITPLRALSKEILKATQEVSEGLKLNYRIALRTGDTTAAERRKLLTNPPHALITTPESVQLLLATKGYAGYFSGLEFVIVDEWHELMSSKRGVLIELALSRLKALRPGLKTWGISATIGNLEQALRILLGADADKGILIRSGISKRIHVETLLPDTLEKFPWGGHLGIRMAGQVLEVIAAHRSTLIFTNTRSQAELWYQQLLDLEPGLSGALALHHGSLSEDLRQWVEASLHDGRLRAIVCTSSLDLGVDFRPVDCVVQIGSPKGIARFIQRAGRSGHSPGAVSHICFVPTHSLEIMEGASLRHAIRHSMLEERIPYIRSFDVLQQYMVTLAVSDGFRPDELFEEIRKTHCFASVSREEFDECLLMITQGGRTLDAYEEFHKVIVEAGTYRVTDRGIAMRHRMSIGAIVSDPMIRVRFAGGKELGMIEEWFVSRLSPGDVFRFSGRQLELIRVKEMQAIVRLAKRSKSIVPSWKGGRLPISRNLGQALRHVLTQAAEGRSGRSPELRFLGPLFAEQRRVSALPTGEELLMEHIRTRYGYHLFVFPFEGKFIHEGMAAVIAYRLSKIRPMTFSIATNEYGFELLSEEEIPVAEALEQGLFHTEGLIADLRRGINIHEMARRRFRDIAAIAGLVFQGYPGRQKASRHIQASSGLFFSVFEDHDPANLLLVQAYEEVADFQLETARMLEAFGRIQHQRIVWTRPAQLTPFAFPVFAESFRERYSNEDWETRLEKLKQKLLNA